MTTDHNPRDIVEAIISDTPDHKAGTRPVHTIGIACKGHFRALKAARRFSVAEHFQGHQVPVTVRFSNGSGSPAEHDGWSDVRGMATRFHLQDDAATDLVMMTLAAFFTQTIDEFLEFTEAARPEPIRHQRPWSKIYDMMRLMPPMPDPPPGQMYDNSGSLLQFANAHRDAQLAVFSVGSIGAPVSYVRAYYHGVNTFVAVGPDEQRRHVRFEWQPVAGVLNTDPTAPPVDEYLHAELRDRLSRWPARFLLNMVIGEPGDAVLDPTRPWPKRRTKIAMGTLILTDVVEDQERYSEKIGFNPCRLTPGLELSDDPILQARKDVYDVSQEMRGACPFHGRTA